MGLVCVLTSVLLLGACSATRPTLKIGLIAPFEGAHRSLGYEVLGAVKLAVTQHNRREGVRGLGIELVALNDDGDPEVAARQVKALAADPGVIGVIGPWQTSTARAAAPEFAGAGLAALVPAALPDLDLQSAGTVFRLFAGDQALARALATQIPARASVRFDGDLSGWPAALAGQVAASTQAGTRQVLVLSAAAEPLARELASVPCAETGTLCLAGPEAGDPLVAARAGEHASGLIWVTSLAAADCAGADMAFCAAYAQPAGSHPGRYAAAAYMATQVLLDAVQAANAQGVPSRADVVAGLARSRSRVLTYTVQFDAARSWREAPALLERFDSR